VIALSTPAHTNTQIVGDLPLGRLEVAVDNSELAPQDLFSLATRNNPKRAFLFVSHVLGKHLAVTPAAMADVHERIARHIPTLPQPIVFIGMAETATCLGQGVFEAWRRAHPEVDALYLHTTRYEVPGNTPIHFEEAHSHAPLLWLYEPKDAAIRAKFQQARSLVLIDDEISTGNTFVNLTHACRSHAPAISHVHFAAITDFTGAARRATLHERIPAQLSEGSLLYGQWQFEPNGQVIHNAPAAQSGAANVPHLQDNGFARLGRTDCVSLPPQAVDKIAQGIRTGDKVLVLGTGEFMHAAFVLARALQQHTGAEVKMHATTRSPIVPWGPIHSVMSFPDNYGEGITNYLYNYRAGQYDHCFLCHETGPNPALTETARLLGARLLHFRSEFEIEENPVC